MHVRQKSKKRPSEAIRETPFCNTIVLMFGLEGVLLETSNVPEPVRLGWRRVDVSGFDHRRPFWVRPCPHAATFLKKVPKGDFACVVWSDEDDVVAHAMIRAAGLSPWIRRVFTTNGGQKDPVEYWNLRTPCSMFFIDVDGEFQGEEYEFELLFPRDPTPTQRADGWSILSSALKDVRYWRYENLSKMLVKSFLNATNRVERSSFLLESQQDLEPCNIH
jgi:hypothetical protein